MPDDFPPADVRLPLRERLWLLWNGLLAHLHRCPECGRRPYRRFRGNAPRWDADPIPRTFGWLGGRCGDCGGVVQPRLGGRGPHARVRRVGLRGR